MKKVSIFIKVASHIYQESNTLQLRKHHIYIKEASHVYENITYLCESITSVLRKHNILASS
jgi:hypothetical protein